MKVSDDVMYGRQALSKGEPWIVPDALDYLRTIVKPSWCVFEWGAGGSTLWFAKNCSVTITVEHARKWHGNIKGKLPRDATVVLRYIPIHKDNHDYADAILKHPDGTFDLVSVDGEVGKRDRCLKNTWKKVVPGGYVMLDNSNWWKGEIPDGWTRVDFIVRGLKWIGVREPFAWQTSFFKKGLVS